MQSQLWFYQIELDYFPDDLEIGLNRDIPCFNGSFLELSWVGF
ncbi:MAG: hypothetical protein ABJP45_04085 [Cyclobacteriaceae bacterium]